MLSFVLVLLASYNGYGADCCPEPDLTIFFTSDTRGYLRRCGCSEGQMGGLSARASYIKKNGRPGRTLVLDAGDVFFPGLEVRPGEIDFYALKARTMARAMSEAGTNAAAVGEFDLAYGREFLLDAVKDAGFPFLSANAAWDGKSPFAGSTVVEIGGVRVGIAGVLGSGFPYGDFAGNFGPVSVSGPAEAANAEIGRLSGMTDLVIVLTHLSVDPVEGLAEKLAGADIVIQGHSAEHLDAPEHVGRTLLFKGYMIGKHMGRLDVWLEHDPDYAKTGSRIVGYEFSVVDLDESVEPDPAVEEIISGYRDELKERSFVFDKEDPAGAGTFTGPETCRGCHAEQYDNWSDTAHSVAFAELTGLGDQYDPECLPCHTTGYGYKSGYANGRWAGLVNVTCESCHGRGSGHVAEKAGSSIPGQPDVIRREVDELTCMVCHDEANSPHFEYERYLEMGGAHRGFGATAD